MQCARLSALIDFLTKLVAQHPDNGVLARVLEEFKEIFAAGGCS